MQKNPCSVVTADDVSYGSGTVEDYLNNLAANQISYGGRSVKDALDQVSNIYATGMKSTSGGSTVTFNIPDVPPSGYIEIVGEANTNAVFSIIPVHSTIVRTERITHLASSFTATFSNGVLTITGGQWWMIQAIASFPIS
jgi:hypothetical protein